MFSSPRRATPEDAAPLITRYMSLYGLCYYVGKVIMHIFIITADEEVETVLKLCDYNYFYSFFFVVVILWREDMSEVCG